MHQQTNSPKIDVLIIGGGPASLAAAIYAIKGNLNVTFIERDVPGGKMVKTELIENYPGYQNIDGPELAIKMLDHAQGLGANFIWGNVIELKSLGPKRQQVTLEGGTVIEAKFVIIATGMVEKVPQLENIEKLKFKGVSYCAICDGALFRDKIVAVMGGGNSAVEESIYLSSVAKEVHLFVRKSIFRADKSAVEKLYHNSKIKIHLNSEITKLLHNEKLTGLEVNINGIHTIFNDIVGLFPYIGTSPQIDFASKLEIVAQDGFIQVNEHMETKVPGIYAAGDVISKLIRQISTAINDGTIAAKSIINKNAE